MPKVESSGLESLVPGDPIMLYVSTHNRIRRLDGEFMELHFPWYLHLRLMQSPRSSPGQGIAFAGYEKGIVRVEKTGGCMHIVYSNGYIPVPYSFSGYKGKEDVKKLNAFREVCFGRGSGFGDDSVL